MADDLQDAREAIERQIVELQAQIDRLKSALAYLEEAAAGDPSASPAPPRRQATRQGARAGKRSAKSNARPSSRAPRGERQKQFLAVVAKQPGVKATEIAKELGITPNQVHGLAYRLTRSGQIQKQARGGYALAR